MTVESAIKTYLSADATLSAALTGGIYAFLSDTGRNGLGRDSTPNAFSTGYLRPSLVIRQRSQLPIGGIDDGVVQSTRQVVELWFYDDGDTTQTLDAIAERARVLLHRAAVTGAGGVKWLGVAYERDPSLENAYSFRAEIQVITIQGEA